MLLNYSIQSGPKDVGVKMNGTKKRNQKLYVNLSDVLVVNYSKKEMNISFSKQMFTQRILNILWQQHNVISTKKFRSALRVASPPGVLS